jgi:transposase
MRGDGAYGSIENRKGFKGLGTQLVAPEKTSHNKGEFPKERFFYDDKNKIVVCPGGMVTTVFYYNKGTKSNVFFFDKEQCGPCPLKQKCTKNDFRTISIHEDYAVQLEAKEYNTTEDYKEDMKMRSHIEPKQAEMKRFHGLERANYRGLVRVGIQAIYTAIVVNLKRMTRVMFSVSSRPKPAGET